MKKSNVVPLVRRVQWHLFRSPFGRALKVLKRTLIRESLARRRALLWKLPGGAAIEEAVEHFRRHGYAHLQAVVSKESLAALQSAAEEKVAHLEEIASAQKLTHKAFWIRLLDGEFSEGPLRTDDPFVAFALQSGVLAVLGRVLGELPHLDDVLLSLSRYSEDPLSYSQMWHRDHDDPRTIKVFVYLSDVASGDQGPFTFLPGPVSDRFGFSLHSHRPDEQILSRVAPAEVKAMCGPKLSVFAVETSKCLHMGSRLVQGHERLLYTATFIQVPRLFQDPPARFTLVGDESEAIRCVLSPR